MTQETVVAVYDTAAHADAAVRDLEAINVPSSAISRHSGGSMTSQSGATGSAPEKGFWAGLFGGESSRDAEAYDRSMTATSAVVTVKVTDTDVQRVTDVLERHDPVDMDERAAAYGSGQAGSTTTTTATPTAADTAEPRREKTLAKGGEEVIALSEEELAVGKRTINRGTTRIRRFVVETPVEQDVTLHSESVSVERRAVEPGSTSTNADFSDRVIEVTESDEEAVVGKTAHVKEEVVINKQAADRVETVRETVRHEDVEITKEGQDTKTTGTSRVDDALNRPVSR